MIRFHPVSRRIGVTASVASRKTSVQRLLDVRDLLDRVGPQRPLVRRRRPAMTTGAESHEPDGDLEQQNLPPGIRDPGCAEASGPQPGHFTVRSTF